MITIQIVIYGSHGVSCDLFFFFLCVPKICVACVFLFYNFAVSKESSCSSHEGCDGTTGKVFASRNLIDFAF